MAALSLPLFKFKYVDKLLHVGRRTPAQKLNGLSTAHRWQMRHFADKRHGDKDNKSKKKEDGSLDPDFEAFYEKRTGKSTRKGFYQFDLDLMDPTQLWPRKRRNRKLRQMQIEFEQKRRAQAEAKMLETMEQEEEQAASMQGTQLESTQRKEKEKIRYETKRKEETPRRQPETAETAKAADAVSKRIKETEALHDSENISVPVNRSAEHEAQEQKREMKAKRKSRIEGYFKEQEQKLPETVKGSAKEALQEQEFEKEPEVDRRMTEFEIGERLRKMEEEILSKQRLPEDDINEKLRRIEEEIHLKQQQLKEEISEKQRKLEKAIAKTKRQVAEYAKEKEKKVAKLKKKNPRYDKKVGIKFKPEKHYLRPNAGNFELELISQKKWQSPSKDKESVSGKKRKPEVSESEPMSHVPQVEQKRGIEFESESTLTPHTRAVMELEYVLGRKSKENKKESWSYNTEHDSDYKSPMKGKFHASSEQPGDEYERDELNLSNRSTTEIDAQLRSKNRKNSLELEDKAEKFKTKAKVSEEHEESARRMDTDVREKANKSNDTKDYFNQLKLSALKPKSVLPPASNEKFLKSQYSAKDVQEHFQKVKRYLRDFPTALSFQGTRFGLDSVEIRYFNDDQLPNVEEPIEDLDSRKIFEQNEEPYPSLAVSQPVIQDATYTQLYSKPIKELSYRGYEIRSYCDSRSPTDPTDSEKRIDKRKNLTSRENANKRDGDFRRLTQTIKKGTFRRDKGKVQTTDVKQKPLVPSTAAQKRKPPQMHIKTKRIRCHKSDELLKEMERERKLKLEREKLNEQMAKQYEELEKQHRFIVNYRRTRLQKQELEEQEKKQKQNAQPESQTISNDAQAEIKKELCATDERLKQIREQVDRLIVKYQLDQHQDQTAKTKTENDDTKQGTKKLQQGRAELLAKPAEGSVIVKKLPQQIPEEGSRKSNSHCEYPTPPRAAPAEATSAPNHYSAHEFHAKQVDKLLHQLTSQSGNTPNTSKKFSDKPVSVPSKTLKEKTASNPVKHLTYVITQPIAPKDPKTDNEPSAKLTSDTMTNALKEKLKEGMDGELIDTPSLTVRKQNTPDIKDSLYKLTYASISDFLKSKTGGTVKSSTTNDGTGGNSLVTPLNLPNIASMQEFFRHPLTWEKNNGYLNLLVALGLLGYCLSAPKNLALDDVEYNAIENDSEESY